MGSPHTGKNWSYFCPRQIRLSQATISILSITDLSEIILATATATGNAHRVQGEPNGLSTHRKKLELFLPSTNTIVASDNLHYIWIKMGNLDFREHNIGCLF